MLQKSYHTKATEAISEFITSMRDHSFTAAELADFLKEHGLDVNKTTIYRNLDKLTENGTLIKHKSQVNDGFIYQEASTSCDCHEHIHFQCSKCGSVLHLSDEKTADYLKSISETLGLEIDTTSSTLNGLCPKCRT